MQDSKVRNIEFSLSLMLLLLLLLLLSTPLVNQNSRGEVEAIHAHHGMDGMGKEGKREQRYRVAGGS